MQGDCSRLPCGLAPKQAAGPDREPGSTYARRVITFVTRILATLALVAAGLWVVLPAVVVVSATPAHAESVPCSCCDEQPAIGGGIACPGCQVGVPMGTALPARHLILTAAWSMGVATETAGIAPVPAEPPPR